MVAVVVLGSGTPNPDPDRAGSAVAVVDGDDWVLVDCGRGSTLRAVSARLELTRLVGVFLTHHHSDHISDLATLAIARWAAGATTALVVHAPVGPASAYAEHCLDAFDDDCFVRQSAPGSGVRPTIEVRAFEPSAGVTVVSDADGWVMRTSLVDHHPVEPAVGYRIERDDDVVMVSGDTCVCDGVRSLATGAHVIVHEALLAASVSPTLLQWNASAESVGALAATIGPRALVLTHLIPAPTSPHDEQAYLDDVRSGGFTGRTFVAHDLLRIETDRP